MIALLPHQVSHVEQVKKNLETFRIAVDTSPTGSGKTFTSLYQASQLNLPVCVIAPKSVSLVWENLVKDYKINTHSINSYDLVSRRNMTVKTPVFLIIDEFHFIKNQTKRYRTVLRLLKSLSSESKVLFLSATPYDKDEHYLQMSGLFRAVSSIGVFTDVVCSMNYRLAVPLTVTNGYYKFEDSALETYQAGVATLEMIAQFQNAKRPPPPGLIARLIGAGTRDTHLGSIGAVIRLAKDILVRNETTKVVIIGKFIAQLDFIADSLEEYGVVQLDGRTIERMEVLEEFQAPNLDARVIITSAQVGGVGINLDDQHGGYPRHMLILPSYECIDMIQCIGRIYRSNTKSAANATVVYNNQVKCPIQESLTIKSKVIRGVSSKSLVPDIADFVVFREDTEPLLKLSKSSKGKKGERKEFNEELPKKVQKQMDQIKACREALYEELSNKLKIQ